MIASDPHKQAKRFRSPLTLMSLGLIWVYQRFISPRKGFACAHRVLHGGPGCSGYAKHAIRDHGVISAIPLIRERFKDCRTAYETIEDKRAADKNRKKKKEKDSCAPEACDAAECSCDSIPLIRSCFILGRSKGGGRGASEGCDSCDACDAIGGCAP